MKNAVRESAASVTDAAPGSPALSSDMSWFRVLEHHASRTPDEDLLGREQIKLN